MHSAKTPAGLEFSSICAGVHIRCSTGSSAERVRVSSNFSREYDMFKQVLAGFLALLASVSLAAVDVNKATVADLDSIKGIGPGTSAKILEARGKAPFKNWEDFIARVPGIGDKKAAKLSGEGLTVQGEAYKGATTAAKPEKAEKVAKAKPAASTATDTKAQKP